MKLFVLCFMLILWSIPQIRAITTKRPLINGLFEIINKVSHNKLFSGTIGMVLSLIFFGALLNLINALLFFDVLRCGFQTLFLFIIISSLLHYPLSFVMPKSYPYETNPSDIESVPTSLWQINYQWISPLFWYLIAGLFGLLFYSMMLFLQQKEHSPWQPLARTWLEMLAWIPARLLAFAYAIAGSFSQGFKILSDYIAASSNYNHLFLAASAFANLKLRKNETQESAYQRLRRDAVILLLGIYALAALVSWLF